MLLNRTTTLLIASIIAITGCAQKSENIQASYASPIQYESYNCRQVGEEAARISSRVAQISGVQDKNAQKDTIATGVALVVFWPAAFFIGGNKENRSELARLKGEIEALEQASIKKSCEITFQRSAEA